MAEEVSFETEIMDRLNNEPFQPFALTAASGERYEINNQDELAVGSSTITVYRQPSGFVVVRKSQLVALHVP